jgi:hypothetical protein
VVQESTVQYPNVTVQLMGEEHNDTSVVLGIVTRAMRSAAIGDDEIKVFMREALSDDYLHMLATCFRYVNVE